jgi:hypothetical protein
VSYRRRPEYVDAIHFDGLNARDVAAFLDARHGGVAPDTPGSHRFFNARRTVDVPPDHWVVRYANGAIFVYRDKLFRDTYEPMG